MYEYPNSVLASSTEDLQGERLTPEQLQTIVDTFPGRMPLNREHDLGKPSIGYAENLRLEEADGVYRLVGDIRSEVPLPDGLSLSATSSLPDAPNAEVRCYLPYPAYNDAALVALLSEGGTVTVGRLQRKALTPVEIGLVTAIAALLIGPEWNRQYERRVRPQILKVLATIRTWLSPREIEADVRMSMEIPGSGKAELLLIPDRRAGTSGQSIAEIDRAIADATAFVMSHERQDIRRIRSVFYPDRRRYEIINVQYQDGDDLNLVP